MPAAAYWSMIGVTFGFQQRWLIVRLCCHQLPPLGRLARPLRAKNC